MKFLNSVFVLAVLFLASDVVFADDVQSVALMGEYVSAIKKGDDTAITSAWSKIDADPSAQLFLKENYPNQYKSYSLWGIRNRIEKLKGGGSGPISTATPVLAGPASESDRPGSGFVRQEPNQVSASGASISRSSLNQRSISNDRISSESQNRFRESNQSRLRSAR